MKIPITSRWLTLLLFFIGVVAINAYSAGLPWADHNRPFDFVFENHFDTHQQSKINGGKEKLTGFFYIEYTGAITDGLPNAQHGTETVGWVLDGLPVNGALLIDNSGPHPTWCLDPEDIPPSPGYTHFHWLGEPQAGSDLEEGEVYDGYLFKLTAIDHFYFEHGGFPITPGIDYDSHYNIEIDEFGNDCEF